MHKYLLTIAYDGTAYSGWQYQPNALSIQQVLESAFQTILKRKISVVGCSRTDAGVHAYAQKAQIILEEEIEGEKLLYCINGVLPLDIRVKKIEKVPSDFHVRFDAKKKIYHYHIVSDLFHDPCKRGFSLHVRHRIDLDSLKKAIPYFIGTHDFKAFANQNSKGSASNCSIKTIYAINLTEERGGYLLEFIGNGFLYKMVRNIVGTLLECAKGKLCPEKIPELLKQHDRRLVPKAAPAHGLFLVDICYDKDNSL